MSIMDGERKAGLEIRAVEKGWIIIKAFDARFVGSDRLADMAVFTQMDALLDYVKTHFSE